METEEAVEASTAFSIDGCNASVSSISLTLSVVSSVCSTPLFSPPSVVFVISFSFVSSSSSIAFRFAINRCRFCSCN